MVCKSTHFLYAIYSVSRDSSSGHIYDWIRFVRCGVAATDCAISKQVCDGHPTVCPGYSMARPMDKVQNGTRHSNSSHNCVCTSKPSCVWSWSTRNTPALLISMCSGRFSSWYLSAKALMDLQAVLLCMITASIWNLPLQLAELQQLQNQNQRLQCSHAGKPAQGTVISLSC